MLGGSLTEKDERKRRRKRRRASRARRGSRARKGRRGRRDEDRAVGQKQLEFSKRVLDQSPNESRSISEVLCVACD